MSWHASFTPILQKHATDFATMRTDFKNALPGIRSELDNTNSNVATMQDKFSAVFYVVIKGETQTKEVAEALNNKKRLREKDKQRKKVERKKTKAEDKKREEKESQADKKTRKKE